MAKQPEENETPKPDAKKLGELWKEYHESGKKKTSNPLPYLIPSAACFLLSAFVLAQGQLTMGCRASILSSQLTLAFFLLSPFSVIFSFIAFRRSSSWVRTLSLLILLGSIIVLISGFSTQYLGEVNCSNPEVCTMPSGMSCAKFSLASDGGILQLTLVNNLQKPIVVTSVTCTKKPDQFIRLLNTTMESGQEYTFLLNCNGLDGELLEFSPGEAFSGKINIEYYFADEGPANSKKLSGNIYVKAD